MVLLNFYEQQIRDYDELTFPLVGVVSFISNLNDLKIYLSNRELSIHTRPSKIWVVPMLLIIICLSIQCMLIVSRWQQFGCCAGSSMFFPLRAMHEKHQGFITSTTITLCLIMWSTISLKREELSEIYFIVSKMIFFFWLSLIA